MRPGRPLPLAGLVLLGCHGATAESAGEAASATTSASATASTTVSDDTSTSTTSTAAGPTSAPSTSSSESTAAGTDTATATTTTTTRGTSAESTTASATESSAGTTVDSDTEAPPPVPVSARITDENRHHETMFGGWGPHLRGLMRAADDTLWFTVDAGPDVNTNQAIRYFHQDGDAWVEAAAHPHGAGVQQNAASVMLGGTIYTYSVNIGQSYLEECTLDTAAPQDHACNAILISGQVYATPPASNYVGAAAFEGSTRVVWWTRVGEGGGAGDWLYTYNFGGGWNGPVVAPILGGNDFAYVHAAFVDPGTLAVVGQLYYGQYPNGTFGAAVAEFKLGQAPAATPLAAGEPGVTMVSTADLWVDRASGATHVLARDDQGGVRYYFKPAGAPWADHASPLHTFASTFRARLLRPVGDDLWIARGDPSGGVELLRVPGADPSAAIDWALADAASIPAPGPGFAPPSAIYVETEAYQTAAVDGLNLAFCGEYKVADHEIWWATLVGG